MSKAFHGAAWAALFSFAAVPISAQTTVVPFGTYTGGSNFATSVTGGLTYLNGVLTLTIQNNGPGVFSAIGIANAPSSGITAGTAPSGWTWNKTQQLSGDGLPLTTWAWVAPPPRAKNGLPVGGALQTFTFNIGSLTNYQNIGFAVQAISGPGGCSTKFGVWNGGASSNDAVANGGTYDPTCVTVPEPESMALLATGLAAMAFVGARRRKELLDRESVDLDA